MTTLEAKVNIVAQRQDDLEKDSTELARSVSYLANDIETVKKDHSESIATQNGEISQLQRNYLYLNSYSRRENLKFFGITEDEAEDPDSKLMFFLQHSLKIKEAETIEFQRVHRLGPKRQSSDRPIIARFLRFPDRERVLNNAFMLKGTRYRIMEDHPKEIIEERRKLMPTLRQARSQGKKVNFNKSMPDRLVIDGIMMDT